MGQLDGALKHTIGPGTHVGGCAYSDSNIVWFMVKVVANRKARTVFVYMTPQKMRHAKMYVNTCTLTRQKGTNAERAANEYICIHWKDLSLS